MSQTKAQAQASAIANKTAAQTAADTLFIAATDGLIADTVAQGKFEVTVNANKDVNIHTIYMYYAALGYFISFPDHRTYGEVGGPSNLFGVFWEAFWQNGVLNRNVKTPVRLTLGWGFPRPPYDYDVEEEEV